MSTYQTTVVRYSRPFIVETEGDSPVAAAARAGDTPGVGDGSPGADAFTPAQRAASAVPVTPKPSRGPSPR